MRIPDVLRARLLLLAAAAILGGLSLHWYTASVADIEVPGARTGWEALGVLDVYLLLLALACIAFAPLRSRAPRQLDALRLGLTAAGTLGVAAVVYRIVSPPGGALPGFVAVSSVSVGPFVTLAGVVLVVALARPSEDMPLRA
ncbi:MAG: hypothetical protein JWM31_2269 [Solirubrobacterales bacterium]|nr:hypothetical protein [Solirubrobacterales bacterium]